MDKVLGVIVEGHGEQAAMGALISRISATYGLQVRLGKPPFRVPRGRFSSSFRDFPNALQLLSSYDGILVVLDADGDCPVELARELRNVAQGYVSHVPVEVVVAHHEYEAWIVASASSMHGYRGCDISALEHKEPDSLPSPKANLSRSLADGSYSETVDQKAMSSRIDCEVAARNSRSFRRLVSALKQLAG